MEMDKMMNEKIVFAIDIRTDIEGRKNQHIKTFLNLLDTLKIDPEKKEIIRVSFLDALSGFSRSTIKLIENVMRNIDA
jgi:hypothetical protein